MPLFVKVGCDVDGGAGAGVDCDGGAGAEGERGRKRELALSISEVVLPTEPRISGGRRRRRWDDLSRLFPATFGAFNATYLDRTVEDHAAAVEQLDTLVKAGAGGGGLRCSLRICRPR